MDRCINPHSDTNYCCASVFFQEQRVASTEVASLFATFLQLIVNSPLTRPGFLCAIGDSPLRIEARHLYVYRWNGMTTL